MYDLQGKLTFGCMDCCYFEYFYRFVEMIGDYWETEYGICTYEGESYPFRAERDICAHFTEQDFSHKNIWHNGA